MKSICSSPLQKVDSHVLYDRRRRLSNSIESQSVALQISRGKSRAAQNTNQRCHRLLGRADLCWCSGIRIVSHSLLKIYHIFICWFFVKLVQLFESHAGALDHNLFVKFALPYIRVISKRVRDKLKERNVPCVPMVHLIELEKNIFDQIYKLFFCFK